MRWRLTAGALLLWSCGSRSGLVGFAVETDAGADASPIDSGAEDASLPPADAGTEDGSAGEDEAAPPPCSGDPCVVAPLLALGATATGTTCGAVNPSGCTCSEAAPTSFHRFTVPPASELNLSLSANLLWGVLCGCPQPGCCVAPGGSSGATGGSFAIPNKAATPLEVTLAVSRADTSCGTYSVLLGP